MPTPTISVGLRYRLPGFIAIVLCFLAQSVYEHFLCGGGFIGFWLVTCIALLPVAALLLWSNPVGAPAAAAVILLFSFWANSMECKPYTGGGAAMAYVVVFLYGWPASLAVGTFAGFAWQKSKRAPNAL
jgi:hypothetical protein